MGGTLPLFARQFVLARRRIVGSVGMLYGVNTLGAASGAAATGLVLLPALGMRGTVALAASLNIGAGAVAMLLRLSRPPPAGETGPTKAARPPRPSRALAALVFLAGFRRAGLRSGVDPIPGTPRCAIPFSPTR